MDGPLESFDQKWAPKAKLRSIFIMETFTCPPPPIIDLNDLQQLRFHAKNHLKPPKVRFFNNVLDKV